MKYVPTKAALSNKNNDSKTIFTNDNQKFDFPLSKINDLGQFTIDLAAEI
jgi:hypothetical protein